MLPDALLEELRSTGESSTLDYKAERYKFAKATDEEKSELLKDILALANTQRTGEAYILLGFKENSPHPAEVVGLSAEGAIDDSRIQEFVNQKLENKLDLKYEEQLFACKHVAVITIPKQSRPFYLSKSYGKVEANTVYVRRGSSTGIATPREIYRMGIVDQSRGEPLFELNVLDHENQPLGALFKRVFLTFDEIPDYGRKRVPGYTFASDYAKENRSYWRECAEYHQSKSCLIRIRLALTNRSKFSLSGTKLEVTWVGEAFRTLTVDDLPDAPAKEWNFPLAKVRSTTEVDEASGQPVYQSFLGDVRPGETKRVSDDMAFLPMKPGNYTMKVRVLANEISCPYSLERLLTVEGECQHLSFDGLQDLLDND
ncbi:ATP-binding protein [Xanthomonas sp. LMG 12461]|uniref:AlbA family DNA-binding domain-containing protein n=1 Tax=Xanthomonas sp. LMG 12461 TaxID=2014543 RepID=UPI0012647A42|nr:ATP-binding protein [Xanthomonas sp. LMG 12461]KAB7766710.1 hypothetical protein CEK68_09325 [Xanthomonas sp. LMG 12461]